MIIISGPMPGSTGVGRLMSHLMQEAKSMPEGAVRIIVGWSGVGAGKALRQVKLLKFLAAVWKIFRGGIRLLDAMYDTTVLETDEPLVLIHLQTLGYNWCKRVVEKRSGPTWVYLMDSSFFCIRSYNHIPEERKACLRCLGGDWRHSKELNCPHFPFGNFRAMKLVGNLKRWVKKGRIKLLVQNRIQAELARRHFGEHVGVKIAGMWAADWPELENVSPTREDRDGEFDVVYHGACDPAKGYIWAMDLARHCLGIKFLFPCSKPDSRLLHDAPPPNCHFVFMNWETGLAEAVQKAKLVLVPSLWSAPIEGALLKSVIFGRSVAVANEPTAFSSELPEGLLLCLPLDVKQAAKILRQSIECEWKPDEKLRQDWLAQFYKTNRGLLGRLLSLCQEASNLQSTRDIL